MSELVDILEKLIAFESVTPHDEGCQQYMIEFLSNLGFSCLQLDNKPVSNFFAHRGTQGPLLVFAGHTDVVPVGCIENWNSNPFKLTKNGNILYGRGVADMKGSLACMLMLAERWVKSYPDSSVKIGFLITSGEEGDNFDLGTPFVMQQLKAHGIDIDYCVVGEPSSTKQVGDVIKIGRRGSLTAKMKLQGIQGHVAYPHLADNPIHRLAPALAQLCTMQWDEGNAWFPPTTMQITKIHSDGKASNVIPGDVALCFNFRYSTENTASSLKEKVLDILKEHKLNPTLEWRLNGEPFLTNKGLLLESAQLAISEHTGLTAELSTSGGTSDGRFIAPYGVEVVEIGPVNASIHQVNEWVNLDELITLEKIYFTLCQKLLSL
ncbi:MAG: succinyl-diaminopimelate desuccinylase [Legionella sp.]|nr:succinyl-diaminopimelate desuccinylase [Legionella sp.]